MQEKNDIKENIANTEISEEIIADSEMNETTTEEQNLSFALDEDNSKVEELQNSIMRLKADFDNYTRITQEEREQLATFVTADVISKILPVLDSFKRAQDSLPNTVDENIKTGLDMILKQFEQAFTNIGVEKIVTEGKFDPELHEAMMRGDNPDLEEGSIEMVFEEGYRYKNKVVRHSKVKVVG